MRLTKIKLAGFKSFVDPTTVSFPSNLTGVVGPNGCGKSNVIDAVRWVMGELSAKHLRGDSMADVIFNGSSARKPVGKASVELVFDNADGKIGGAWAAYNEVSLKREVARDGSSNYYLNGARCRRKDITQLFLGTGLGSRSYAIIEQGMISRIIEAKADDMRAFVEEAAGISRYKERRRETEGRIADTRENLERLQDVRDEVDKQIRHLQRQAATARRYQALKEQERKLTAELLALRMRELESGAEVHDSTVRERDLTMQSALAALRGAEAAIEKQRTFHGEQSELVSQVQGRYYTIGADISRSEQQIQFMRETHARHRNDLAQAQTTITDLARHIERDEAELANIRVELERLAPDLDAARSNEQAAAAQLEQAELAVASWQQNWESFNGELGAAHQTTQVERARIEQLENQMRRLNGQSDRLSLERDELMAQEANALLSQLTDRESTARSLADELARALTLALGDVQQHRTDQLSLESRLEHARADRERVRAEVMSLDALQKAALGRAAGATTDWLLSTELGGRPRIAEALSVQSGWETAVETVLGDYLEAVCVDGLDELTGVFEKLGAASLTVVETSASSGASEAGSLAACVQGPQTVVDILARVQTAKTLAEALARRRKLGDDESIVTRNGEWIGRHWLRVSRGQQTHSGVLEREARLKSMRTEQTAAEQRVRAIETLIGAARERLIGAEALRDGAQSRIQLVHREHADLLGQLEATRARQHESLLRRQRLELEIAEIAREVGTTQAALGRARGELDRGLLQLEALDGRRGELESQREEHRERHALRRAAAQAGQLAARDLLIRLEGRRSSASSMNVGLARMVEQSSQLAARAAALQSELANGDGPVLELEQSLAGFLARRLEVEAELTIARRGLEEADSELRGLDGKRQSFERRVHEAREAAEQARMAAQETRVRRESLAEQFAATQLDLGEVMRSLSAAAEVPVWESQLGEVRADIEKLGQVNLAAIDELKENTERKEYLDRQYNDLTSALDTLEQAMRKIDTETRSRFEDTFNRINAGLQEKFPRLFGGGHAYLELVGDDPLSAGVAVMARPPGKRNSTISQLSGGEKALTAVALVFAIFELNPAPFCLLDEVDAPLDEHNVGRFCEIVSEMAQRVQFIFITHNKATMELASQLMGVTMSEPGVSRLVAVDVEEALRLAAS